MAVHEQLVGPVSPAPDIAEFAHGGRGHGTAGTAATAESPVKHDPCCFGSLSLCLSFSFSRGGTFLARNIAQFLADAAAAAADAARETWSVRKVARFRFALPFWLLMEVQIEGQQHQMLGLWRHQWSGSNRTIIAFLGSPTSSQGIAIICV